MKKEIMILVGAVALAGCGFDGHFSFGEGIQGSGKSKTESRTVGNFDRIDLAGSTNVTWKQGSTLKVTVKCDDNLLAHLKTEVKGDTLKVYFDTNVNTKTDALVEIVSPKLLGAGVTGSGDLDATGISAGAFSGSITGSGNLTLKGSAESADFSVTGSGDLDGSGLSVKSAEVSVTGSGNVGVNASTKLQASIMGSGDVAYVGSPKVESNVTGSGEVHKK